VVLIIENIDIESNFQRDAGVVSILVMDMRAIQKLFHFMLSFFFFSFYLLCCYEDQV
jgi:hypothetical protein